MSAVAAAAPSRTRPGRILRTLSDERLVARVRAGDQAAFEVVYDRYHRSLLSFCRHMLGTREEAEDALQQVCISAYSSLLADDRPIQLKAWLFTIARNRCLTMLRARREHADVDDVQPAVEGLASEVQRREDLREMLGDLQRLPDEQRAALVLTELGAHTHEEVAVILDVRKEKVKALVFQAREQLVGARQARETDCSEIREQLSTLRGGALRRTQLRKHLDACAGCSAFKLEVQRQRAAMAVLLPVVPGSALKGTVLAGVFGAGGTAGGAGIGGGAIATGTGAAAAGVGAATGGGGLFAAIGAQGVAVKALAALAVAGGAGGSGYVAVHELRTTPASPSSTPSAAAPPALVPVLGTSSPASLVRPIATVTVGPVPASQSALVARERAGDARPAKSRRGGKKTKTSSPGSRPATPGAGAQRPTGPGEAGNSAATPGATRGNKGIRTGRPANAGGPARAKRKSAPAPKRSASTKTRPPAAAKRPAAGTNRAPARTQKTQKAPKSQKTTPSQKSSSKSTPAAEKDPAPSGGSSSPGNNGNGNGRGSQKDG